MLLVYIKRFSAGHYFEEGPGQDGRDRQRPSSFRSH